MLDFGKINTVGRLTSRTVTGRAGEAPVWATTVKTGTAKLLGCATFADELGSASGGEKINHA